MARYRKQPVEVEARQLTGDTVNDMDVYKWVEANTQGSFDPLDDERPATGVSIDPETGFMLIATLEGVMKAKPGDYVIRGTRGEFYPCKPDAFADTFVRIDAECDEDPAAKVLRLQADAEAALIGYLEALRLYEGDGDEALGPDPSYSITVAFERTRFDEADPDARGGVMYHNGYSTFGPGSPAAFIGMTDVALASMRQDYLPDRQAD